MKRPDIICHMMTSVDGRIDCAMTHGVTGLKLMDVKRFASDAVWIRYRI